MGPRGTRRREGRGKEEGEGREKGREVRERSPEMPKSKVGKPTTNRQNTQIT